VSLRRLFAPESIAIVGASAEPDSISGRPLRILRQHGYAGRVYPVNPRHLVIEGVAAYPDVASLPEAVDVALVVVNASRVVEVLEACAERGIGFAVVISSGFAEQQDADGADERALAELAASRRVRICGPNCEGLISLHDHVPLGFSPTIDYERGLERLIPGDVSVIAQSGALAFAMFNDAQRRGVGVSCVVSSGNELDLEALDYVEHCIGDAHTRVILLFLEGLRDGRRFGPVADRALAAGKPIVVAKVGRSPAARRAAVSHTAHLAGDDAAYDALFRRHGAPRAGDQEEMVDLAMAFSRCPPPGGDRVGIVTVSGGAGTWLADALADEGLSVPVLDDEHQARIRSLLPPFGAAANPIDVTAQVLGTAGALGDVLGHVLDSARVDAAVLVTTLAGARLMERVRERLAEVIAGSDKPVLVYSYTPATADAAALMSDMHLAWYTSPRRTARALGALVRYGRGRARAAVPPAPAATERGRASASLRRDGRSALLEHEAKRVLSEWGLPTPRGVFVAATRDGLHAAAARCASRRRRPTLCTRARPAASPSISRAPTRSSRRRPKCARA